jgi:hypothetical protein
MRRIILLSLVFLSLVGFKDGGVKKAAPGFKEGWTKGWRMGYELVEGKERSRSTWIPSPAVPRPGTDSYGGGYDAGYLAGIKKATRKKLCRERGEYGEAF